LRRNFIQGDIRLSNVNFIEKLNGLNLIQISSILRLLPALEISLYLSNFNEISFNLNY